MARTVRDAKLDSRERRMKLAVGTRHWRGIHEGLALGYRRGVQGAGKWIVRLREANESYALRTLGVADDYSEADGHTVLTFKQAQQAAQAKAQEAARNQGVLPRDSATVADAAKAYMKWFQLHRKSAKETQYTIDVHILPELGDVSLNKLSTKAIRDWHEALASAPARLRSSKQASPAYREAPKTAEEKRRRQSSANRILTVLKAILNRAFHDGLVSDDTPWRKVKPFAKADEARIRFLTDAEAAKLINTCPPDLRNLVQGALLTGMRYGELRQLRVRDATEGRVYVAESKSGKPRYIPLNTEGRALFTQLCEKKSGDDLVFTKSGQAWGDSHQTRPMVVACEAAGITPAVSFHELRHSFASQLAQAGVDILTISKLLGHADTRVTTKHYAHLCDDTLAAAVGRLPSFGLMVENNG